MTSDLGRRLAVAAIGIPLTVAVTLAGGWLFAAGLGALAGAAVWEIGRMLTARGDRFLYGPAIALAAILPGLALSRASGNLWIAIALSFPAFAGIAAFRFHPEQRPFQATALSLTAALYAGGLLSFGVPLRESFGEGPIEGTLFFFLPVTVTWLSDTAAYLGGRRFGRRKLAPVISPNKTVAGGVSAVLAGPVGVVAYTRLLLPDLSTSLGLPALIALGLLVAAAATVGDLTESALKRECGVKDSSRLLPGHGGLLDRMDSLLWSIPAAYLFLWLLA